MTQPSMKREDSPSTILFFSFFLGFGHVFGEFLQAGFEQRHPACGLCFFPVFLGGVPLEEPAENAQNDDDRHDQGRAPDHRFKIPPKVRQGVRNAPQGTGLSSFCQLDKPERLLDI